MTDEAIAYILDHYPHLLTLEEAAALKQSISGQETVRNVAVQELLKNGPTAFRRHTAERIVKDHAEEIFFNTCPRCGKLARTPKARQCRYCRDDWHHAAAVFRVKSSVQVTGREFFIAGDILSGALQKGMKADLASIGLAIKPVIVAIEFTLHRKHNKAYENVCLGFSDLSADQKEFLKTNSPFERAVLIVE